MAKIDRKTQKIFGSEAGSQQITAFGTAKLDNPTYTSDLDLIQNANFLQGWDSALEDDRAPYREDDAGLWYTVTKQLAYLFQQGISEWDAGTEYTQGSLVSKYNNGEIEIYMSLQNLNLGNRLTETNYWQKYVLMSENSEINLLKKIYPVGAIYIGTTAECPLSSLFGTWEKVAGNRALWTSDSNHSAGSTIAAGLPNVTGGINFNGTTTSYVRDGAIYGDGTQLSCHTDRNSSNWNGNARLNASRSSSIYGQSDTVQPPAYVVNVWKRVA